MTRSRRGWVTLPLVATSTRPRREWTRLETPEALLVAVGYIAADAVIAFITGLVIGDAHCRSNDCQVHGVSTTGPALGIVIGLLVVVVPVGVAWWRRRGLRTAAVVQTVAAVILIVWAANSLIAAENVRRSPPPVPVSPHLRPCAEKTLEGHVCVTYSNSTPPPG